MACMPVLRMEGRKVSDTERSWKSVREVKPSAGVMICPRSCDLTRKEARPAMVGAVGHRVDVIALNTLGRGEQSHGSVAASRGTGQWLGPRATARAHG